MLPLSYNATVLIFANFVVVDDVHMKAFFVVLDLSPPPPLKGSSFVFLLLYVPYLVSVFVRRKRSILLAVDVKVNYNEWSHLYVVPRE